MTLVSNPKLKDDVSVRQAIAKLGSSKLGPTSTPTFAGVTTTTLTISGLTTDSLIYPVSGLLTSLGVATNGQLPIGSTGATPVLTTLTGTAKRVLVTNAAGSITLSGPQDLDTVDSPTFAALTVTGTIQAEHLYSTDDIYANDIMRCSSLEVWPEALGNSTDGYVYIFAEGSANYLVLSANDAGTSDIHSVEQLYFRCNDNDFSFMESGYARYLRVNVAGANPLVTSSTAIIDFDDENLTTTGNLTATKATLGGVVYPDIQTVMEEPTGFINQTATLSWVDDTRTLTITGNHDIYIHGIKTTKTTDSIQIADTTGLHWIYYNVTGTLSEQIGVPGFDVPLMATVYWNTTVGFDKGLAGEERHGIIMDAYTHGYLHYTVGSRYRSGLAGTFDDTTIIIEAGIWYDEDLEHTPTQQTTCNVFYKNESAAWEWDAGVSVYYKLNGTNLRYNNNNTLVDVGANQYMAMWVFITNNITTPVVALIGQRVDTTIANARANNKYESLSLGDLPFEEMKLLYRVILRNTGAPPTYTESLDMRSVSNLSTGTYIATAHSTLTGLASDDHSQYLLIDGTKALAGAWDMGSQALTNVNIDGGVITGITDLALLDGGTGQSTAQAAINALTVVSEATNEHVLTKDTATGNAIFKVTAGGEANHAILDGSVHSDSVADGVTRGSIIYGNATPKWDELIAGVVDTFLGSDGTDISYRTATQVLTSLSGEGGAAFDLNGQDLTNGGVLFLTEQADAEADVAGKGQFWVNTATPCEPYFTGDTGIDIPLDNRFVDRGDPASADWLVGNFTTDGAWRDLDCSGVVPAGAVAILFRVGISVNAISKFFKLRKNGNTNTWAIQGITTQVANNIQDGNLICSCDSGRTVEYSCSNIAFAAIYLTIVGWWLA